MARHMQVLALTISDGDMNHLPSNDSLLALVTFADGMLMMQLNCP